MNKGLFYNLNFDLPSGLVFSGIITGFAGSFVIVSLSNSTESILQQFGERRKLFRVYTNE